MTKAFPSCCRIAVSHLQIEGQEIRHNQVLEIEDNLVVRYYPLTEELPYTEWHSWTVIVATDGSWEHL